MSSIRHSGLLFQLAWLAACLCISVAFLAVISLWPPRDVAATDTI